MIRPTISIKGKTIAPIKIKGKANASIIREYPELENLEITPTTEGQILKSEKYGFEVVTVKGVTAEIDKEIKPENIKVGVNILGIDGGYEGIDTSDATALAEDVLQDKTFYVNNEKVTGTMQEYNGSYSGNVETQIEGFKITLKDKEGVVLHTAKKHCKEDIEVDIDAKQITISPSTEQQIQEGLFGEVIIPAVTADIDEDIKPEHIIEGVNILGVDGGFKGVDSSGATATSEDMLKNKTAYINNEEVQGAIETYDGSYTGEAIVGSEWEALFEAAINNDSGANITKLPANLTSIKQYAFYEKTDMVLTELPNNITSIGKYAFYKCTNLALTELPYQLIDIPSSCFQQCTKLALTKLPDGITKIGNKAFDSCSNMELTELPSGLITIDTYAFQHCTKLKIREIPVGVVLISAYAFYNNEELTSLRFLGEVRTIGDRTFYSCSNLTEIIFPNITAVPSVYPYSFALTPIANGTGYIYVPDDLVDSFKTATNWSTYADQIKPISELEG